MQFHTFDPSETTSQVQNLLAKVEGFRSGAYWDSAQTPRATIGFGFNLEAATGDYLRLVLQELYGTSGVDIEGFVGDFLDGVSNIRPQTPTQYLQNRSLYDSQLQSLLDGLAFQYLQPGQTFEPIQLTQGEATDVERQILEGYTINGVFTVGKLTALQNKLTQNGISVPENSNEFVALASLFYNSESLIGSKLISALQTGNRAEAWYEVRYQSNGGSSSQGIANRRYRESDLFGLYDGGDGSALMAMPDTAESKQVLQMYTLHRDQIRAYESQFSPFTPEALSQGIDFNVLPARNELIAEFAMLFGKTIDGEVLVGPDGATTSDFLTGTQSGDLLFGEFGNDVLKGDAGADVIYGGDGADRIVGGTGNDLLKGDAGFDTYVYRTGDGNDTIEDSDARGELLIDNHLLVGGTASAGSTTYASLDGQTHFSISGGDLYVTLNDGSQLTVNENFSSGQLGIRLFDLPAFGEATRTQFLKVDHYDPNPTPGGDPIPVYAPFFDSASNNTTNTADPGGLTPPIGGDNNLIHALGGDDYILSGAGDDQLYGDDGNDTLFGEGGNDRLYGGIGGDILVGDDSADPNSGGSDYLDGGDGDDLMQGNAGNDVLIGGSGNDNLNGDDPFAQNTGTSDDWLDGGDGYDELHGAAGNDVLIGGAGNDQLYGDHPTAAASDGGKDSLDGGDGDDTLYGVFDDDVLVGGLGNDILLGQDGNDVLYGDDGTDPAAPTGGNAPFGPFNDQLYGGEGSDILYGGAGNDWVQGDGQNDPFTLSMVGGADVLAGDDGNDWLVGGQGDDTLSGGAGNDRLSGDRTFTGTYLNYMDSFSFTGSPGNDALDGGDGSDILIGGEGTDVLTGGAGGDILYGDYEGFLFASGTPVVTAGGNDVLDGGDGNDSIYGGVGADALDGGMGDDGLSGGSGNDVVYGEAGNDSLGGEDGDDVLDGGDGNDFLSGGEGADTLFGGDGDDRLYAFFADVNFGGSPADDVLDGGAGNDRYGVDSLGDTVIEAAGSGTDTVTVAGAFNYTLPDNVENGSGGLALTGNALDNVLSGSLLLDGRAGNDTLIGGSNYAFDRDYGHDTVIVMSASGNNGSGTVQMAADVLPSDVTWQRSGNDLSLSIAGTADQLTVQSFFNLVFFRGDAFYNGSNPLYAYPSRVGQVQFADGTNWNGDTFGLARLGDYQNNTYQFGQNSGHVTVLDYDATGLGVDTVQMAAGVLPSDVVVSRTGGDLVLSLQGTTDQLTVQNHFTTVFPSPGFYFHKGIVDAYRLEQVRFANGTTWNSTTLTNQIVTITGTPGADELFGNGNNNVINGLGGDDYIVAYGGNDLIDGGAGNDQLYGERGSDTYLFGRGSGQDIMNDYDQTGTDVDTIRMAADVLPGDVTLASTSSSLTLKINGTTDQLKLQSFFDYSFYQKKRVEFADGTVWDGTFLFNKAKGLVLTGTAGGDVLAGSIYYDVLNGLGGDDTLSGGAGQDELNGGAGNDTLTGGTGNDMLAGGTGSDVYVFNRGDGTDTIMDTVVPGEGNLLRFGSGITRANLTLIRDQNTLIIQDGTSGDAVRLSNFEPDGINGSLVVETLQFSDGSQVNLADLLGPTSTDGNDVITGGPGDDIIDARGGNDVVDGDGGNDTLTGGTGDDTLIGGAGDDTYVFSLGDGVDTIADTAAPGEGNVVVFGPGVTPDSLSLGLGSLLIRYGTQGDVIHIENFDPNDAYGPHAIDFFQFADGTVLTYSQVIDRGFDLTGTAGDDTITGTNAVDRISGLAGNDTLVGGRGNDVLSGGAGNDLYAFNLGDAVDTIHDTALSGEGNVLQFGAGITQADLAFTVDQNTLTISVGAGGDAIRLADFDPTTVNGSLVVGTLQFAGGASVNLTDLLTPTVANPIADQTTSEDAAFSFMVTADTFAVSINGDTLTYSVAREDGSALPAWLAFQAATGTFSGTPTNDDVGSFNLTVTATDSVSLSVADTFALTITNVNDAPIVAHPIADQNTPAGVGFSFQVPGNTFLDVDRDDTLTYSASLDDGSPLPAWLTFDPVTQAFGGTPHVADVGGVNITVSATDSGNLSVSDAFALTIAPPPNLVVVGTAGDDMLVGGEGNDTLAGEQGNDIIDGGLGNDTYVYNLGDGLDHLADSAGVDTVSFGSGISFDDTVARLTTAAGLTTAHLRLLDADGSELSDQGMDIPLDAGGVSPIEQFVFADGSVFALSDLVIQTQVTTGTNHDDIIQTGRADDVIYTLDGKDQVLAGSGNDTVCVGNGGDQVYGEGGNDVLYGGNGKDSLVGGGGNDTLLGLNGDDTLQGGAGDDALDSGNGADSILFGRGDGQDTLIGHGNNQGDAVQFSSGINPIDLVLSRQANDLRVAIHGSDDRMTIQDWYVANANQTKEFEAGNGSLLPDQKVDQLIQAMAQFSTESGLSWDQAIDQRTQDVQTILAASWQ